MSEEDNKPENTDTTPAPDTPNTLPETSLSLEDDVPAPAAEDTTPTTDVPPAETPPAVEPPAEAAGGLEMDTPVEPTAPAAETPPAVEPPAEATGGLEMDTPVEAAAPAAETPPAVEPPAEATGGLETDTPVEPTAPAAETPTPVEPPAAAGGLEMDAPAEAVVPPAAPEAPATENTDAAFDGDDDGFDDDDSDFIEEDDSGEIKNAAPAKRSKIFMVGGVVLALAVAGAGGYFFLMGDDKTPTSTNIAATTPAATSPNLTTADAPSDMGFAAPPQPQAITTDTTAVPEAVDTAEVTTQEEDSDAVDGFEGFEDSDAPSTPDMGDEFETETADNDAPENDDDIWGTEDTDSNIEDTVDGFTDDDANENTDVANADDSLDPLSEPPVSTETDAVALDDLAPPEEAGDMDVASVESTETNIEDTADAQVSNSNNLDEETQDDAAEESANEENTVDAIAEEADPLTDDSTDTASLETDDVELPEFDPIPEDDGPQIMDTPEAPPQLGFDTAIETAETETTENATANTEEDTTEIDKALAPQDPLKEPQGDLANVVPDLPIQTDSNETTTTAENNTADAALGTGKMETEKTGSHRDQLKEVPAQEALIRPLPKKYLIMKQRSNTKEQRAKKAMSHQSPDTALGILDKMTSANPNDTDLLMKRAITAQRAGQKSTALSTYETILKKNPSDLQALTNMLGLLRSEKPQLALSKLSELRELYPDNPGIAAQLAVSHGSVKNYSEALRFFDIAASLDAPNAYYPFSKGIILDRMGRGGEATTYYRKALKMYRQGQVGSQKISEAILRKRLGMHY